MIDVSCSRLRPVAVTRPLRANICSLAECQLVDLNGGATPFASFCPALHNSLSASEESRQLDQTKAQSVLVVDSCLANVSQLIKMKLSATRRALILANIFNSLVAVYFFIIAIVGLIQLRWYHQLTIYVKVRHLITLTTSYFAFIVLILVGLILLGLFVGSALRLTSRSNTTILTTGATNEPLYDQGRQASIAPVETQQKPQNAANEFAGGPPMRQLHSPGSRLSSRAILLRDMSISEETNTSICCSIVFHLIVTIGLIVILLIWLFNTGELVRDAISTQLDYAFARYQFSNRSNHYSIAIDAMQDINNCCGSLDFTDFPHQRVSGLSSGHYPGSCCGKNIFGYNARVLCTADEIYRAKQTSGCTTILANYYDLISLLVVPVALVCLFVNITIIALITISKRGNISLGQQHFHHQPFTHSDTSAADNVNRSVTDSSYKNRANLRRARRQPRDQEQHQSIARTASRDLVTVPTPASQQDSRIN